MNSNIEYLVELSGNRAKARAAGKMLSIEQLLKLIDGLEVAKSQMLEEQKKADEERAKKEMAASSIIEQMREIGISLDDLNGALGNGGASETKRKTGVKVPAKYRLEDKEWTGRGRKPKWIERYLDDGGNLSDIEI